MDLHAPALIGVLDATGFHTTVPVAVPPITCPNHVSATSSPQKACCGKDSIGCERDEGERRMSS